MSALLVAHLAVTWALVGLIWTIQVVHYPLLGAVGRGAYVAYQRAHMARITWVVGPLMTAELGLALWLVAQPPALAPAWGAPAGLALVAVVWLSTLLLQVPLHAKLATGFDAQVHRRLVRTNWVRTAAWTLRGALALGMLR